MQREAFFYWMTRVKSPPVTEGTAKSRVANCKRVEKYYGLRYLDDLSNPGFGKLRDEFEYSTEDQRAHRPVRHKVPIDGDQHNGTATLKNAIGLYREFRFSSGVPPPGDGDTRTNGQSPPPPVTQWPKWEPPSDDDSLLMARVLARHARFLLPSLVLAIVKDNEERAAVWRAALEAQGIPADAYLWSGSPCAFPGVRRYAGSKEIAVFHGHAKGEPLPRSVLALDDNEYPKQLWSHLFLGKKFPKHGPPGYHLAHLADHKDHENRAADVFENVPQEGATGRLHGLYTCPTNTVYVPAGLLKPTDFHAQVRGLFIRKAQALYGSFCSIVPPPLSVRACSDERWSVEAFVWAPPVGETKNLELFLDFRAKKIEELLRAKITLGAVQAGRAADAGDIA